MNMSTFKTAEEIVDFIDSLDILREGETYDEAAERVGDGHPYYQLLSEASQRICQLRWRNPPDGTETHYHRAWGRRS